MRSLLTGPLADDVLEDIEELAELEGLDEAAVAEIEAMDDAHLIECYAYPEGRTWVRANMVTSVDGAAASDGRSAGLSSPADKRVFKVLRNLADVVVVGAGTARLEGYDALQAKPSYAARRAAAGQTPAPTLAVVTRTAALDLDGPLFRDPSRRPTVVTCASAPSADVKALSEVADVLVVGTEQVDLVAAFDALVLAHGPRVLCEGGPRLLAQVVAAGLLDELCLTVAPLLTGGQAPRLLTGPALDAPVKVRLASLLEENGSLFARYLLV